MVEWLAPIALFWTMSALYFGGFPIGIEGGGAFKQLTGLIITCVLFLVIWFVLRMVLRGAVGTVGAVILACLVATMLLPLLARGAFRVVGVRITSAGAQH